MSIEDQIRSIAKEELIRKLEEIEDRLKTSVKRDSTKIKNDIDSLAEDMKRFNSKIMEEKDALADNFRKENIRMKENLEVLVEKIEISSSSLADLTGRIEKLEEELHNRWSLVVKLRKYTLDQLMSEYKRLTGSMRSEQEEIENAET